MNRRNFLTSLIASIGMPAVIKAAFEKSKPGSPIEIPKIQSKYPPLSYRGDRGCSLTQVTTRGLTPAEMVKLGDAELWMRPSGPPRGYSYSPEYEKVLNEIMEKHPDCLKKYRE